MKIVVLRHAEKCPGKGLTKKGRLQAKKMAKQLKKQGICHLYCGPALRTKKTARLVNRLLSVSVTEHNSLADVGFSGNLSALSTETQESGLSWQGIWLNSGLGFETCEQFIKRVEVFLGKIMLENNSESTVLIVAHEETVWALLNIVNGIPFFEATKQQIPYASIHIFNMD
ncbi:MAG: histidine phosphatase family protein [Minisyncoccales bacterium]